MGDNVVRDYLEAASRMKAHYPESVFRLVGWINENSDAIRDRNLNGWVT